MSLYLIINLAVLSMPLLLSFDKKVAFYKSWKSLMSGILIMMLVFIPWDMAFEYYGLWGFNPNYLSGIKVFNLPLEEVLFFVTVPYACVFIYACLKGYFAIRLSWHFVRNIGLFYMAILAVLCLVFYDKPYTFIASMGALICMGYLLYKKELYFLQYFYPAYLISLVPFFIVNGLLTGYGIEGEIVWYSPKAIMGFRLFTIPVEDTIYNLFMLLMCSYVYYWMEKAK